jgi:ornithine carbamoyltransferase
MRTAVLMNLALNQRLLQGAPLAPADTRALLRSARALAQVPAAAPQPLQGKQIALYAVGPDPDAADEFDAAASQLGARVSRLQPDAALQRVGLARGDDALRVLARLYDAVAFNALDPVAALRLQDILGLPVFCGALDRNHPVQQLRAAFGDPEGSPATRRCLLQAWLLEAMLR